MRTRNWSVNLETEEYVADKSLIVSDACAAIQETAEGCYVNIAVAPDHGHPDLYLTPVLRERFGTTVDVRYVDQCGCGGHVYRIAKLVGPS